MNKSTCLVAALLVAFSSLAAGCHGGSDIGPSVRGETTEESRVAMEQSPPPDPMLSEPVLLSPLNSSVLKGDQGEAGHGVTWDFDWSDSPGADQYQIYIIRTNTSDPFAALTRNSVEPLIDATVHSSSFRVESPQAITFEPTNYCWIWKVRAGRNGQWGQWSRVGIFSVVPTVKITDVRIPTQATVGQTLRCEITLRNYGVMARTVGLGSSSLYWTQADVYTAIAANSSTTVTLSLQPRLYATGSPDTITFFLRYGGQIIDRVTKRIEYVPPTAPSNVIPRMTLSPDRGPAGTHVTVRGTGFTARGPITITYDGIQVGMTYAVWDGSFNTSFTVPASKLGLHWVIAAIDGTSAKATSTFTVVSR